MVHLEVSLCNTEFFKFKTLFFSKWAQILHLLKFMFGQKHILNRHKNSFNHKSGCWGRLKLGTARFQGLSVPNSPDFWNRTWTFRKPKLNTDHLSMPKFETSQNLGYSDKSLGSKFSDFSVLSSLFCVSCFKWILFCKRSAWAFLYSYFNSMVM